MIRSLLIAVGVAAFATAVAWFVIPASTYVEDALGILLATFLATAVVAGVMLRIAQPGRRT
jgi:hypothetical protein